MSIKSTISRRLKEWGYNIKDDAGGILVNDEMTIDIIRPQRYVTIDVPKTKVLSPDLPVNPQEAYEMLCRIIDEKEVDVMVGSSMGGMFANVINGTAKVLVNPSFHVSESMRKRIGIMPFFSERKDGAVDFEITEELCDAYAKLERRQFALFGDEDNTVNCKDEYIKYFGDAISNSFQESMANKNLNKAKEAKKDEFYTQLEDIVPSRGKHLRR